MTNARGHSASRNDAPSSDQWHNSLEKAIELHQKGVDGDKDAVRQAHSLLETINRSRPGDPIAEAYLGSATALLGRDAVDPNERFTLAIKGTKMLDGVIARVPENKEARILRAYVCYRLPETFFHRTETTVEDFKYLIDLYANDASVLTEDFYHQILFDLGKSYKNLGRIQEAEQTWQKLLAGGNSKKYRNLIRGEGMAVPDLDSKEEQAEETAAIDAGRRAVLAKGRELHERALAGKKNAAKEAAVFFAEALRESEADPLIQAYHADCLSMTGRDADDPAEMFAAAIKAMKMLDAAVNAEPENTDIRLIRAGQSLRLPEAFFHRTATALGDLEYLAERADKEPSLMAEEKYWRLLNDLATCYHRLGLTAEAETVWKKLFALTPPAGDYRSLAVEGLKRLRSPRRTMPNLGNMIVSREEGIRLHDAAVAGSAMAARTALAYWEKAFRNTPKDPTVEGYYGSCMALAGRYASEPKDIFTNTIQGLVHLNKAIGRDGTNPKLRIIRAYLTFSLPEAFFHLTERAIKDFRFLKNAYERDNTIFTAEQYHKILFDLGRAYQRTGQEDLARKTWSKLAKLNPASEYMPPPAADSEEDGGPSSLEKEDV